MLVKRTINPDETIEDIACVEYGSVEGVAKLLQDNPGLSWNSVLVPGTQVFIDAEYRSNSEMAIYLKGQNATPASAYAIEIQASTYVDDDYVDDDYVD